MITPADIRNPSRQSGFDHVNSRAGRGTEGRKNIWRASCGWDGSNARWRGRVRATPLEAAQDYCNYVNGLSVAPTPQLKSAGHATKRPQRSTHPKRIEANRLLAEARADEEGVKGGWVYLLTEEPLEDEKRRGLRAPVRVKIGKSADHPKYRLNPLQTGNPRKLVLLGCYECEDRHAEETRLHAKFFPNNELGEWFRPTTAVLSEFGLWADGRTKERKAAA